MLAFFDGYKTYIGAAGLIGAGVFLISKGEYVLGSQFLLNGVIGFGLRNAIEKLGIKIPDHLPDLVVNKEGETKNEPKVEQKIESKV